ncbi:MAG TPA: hypothetical protein VMN60_07585 [Longimicrobiales bacterium]|nr:hypothetical protein [Longimicrobiales bacterium]
MKRHRPAVSCLCFIFVAGCADQSGPFAPTSDASFGIAGAPFLATHVTAGQAHACALGTDRRAYCWGDNSLSQLGDGTTNSSTAPVPVAGSLRFEQITSGSGMHTCALTRTGAAYCWGWNPYGQLGDGTTVDRNAPVRVATNLTFMALDAGTYHTCGLTRSGTAHCWGADGPQMRASSGRNSAGSALGAPAPEQCVNPLQAGNGPYRGTPWPCSTLPVSVAGGLSFGSISAGLWSTCAIAQAGAAYCWGWNVFDQLGSGALISDALAPRPVAGTLSFSHMTIGATHACGVAGGAGYCWGGRVFNFGSLGTGSFDGSSTPAPVAGGLSFTAVLASDANDIFTFTCGLTTDGAAYCWGMNRFGALGTDAPQDTCFANSNPLPCSSVPLPVAGGIHFDALAVGLEFSCGVARNHRTYCWGWNRTGQLGDGTTTSRPTPVAVLAPDRRHGVMSPASAPMIH